MNLEIERRFLVKNNRWRKFIINQVDITQGYLSSNNDNWIVRLRCANKQYKLTLKKHIINSTSLEFEYQIDRSEGNQILTNIKYKIEKQRFFLKINEKDWLVDIFKKRNAPLEIAEIELDSEKEKISIPDFISKEITGIQIFSNYELSKTPFSTWCKEDINKFA
tara:strand:+ start:548 stop:1039 length:492 start_codon:yes stop_codon:yes gene_type:complete